MEKPIPVEFDSYGANIHAIFYQSSGVEPLPPVVLCHGFLGSSGDMFGLGERLMKEGFNALAFNYRGTWGSEGLFTIENSLEDVASAIRYMKSSSTAREFNVDSSSISAIGWSYGGGMALLGSISDPAVRRVVYIAGGNLSEVARMMKHNVEFKQAILKMIDQTISDCGFSSLSAEQLFADLFADMDKYDLLKHVEALSNKDVLIIGGWRDQVNTIEHHILPLVRALQKHKAGQMEIEIFDTNHSFADVRSQLQDRIVSWLKKPLSDKTAR